MKEELNKEQKLFVEATDKKIILRSGAGSGKTRAIVERAKYLVSQGVDPTSIVILTFTNLATQELASRLEDCPTLVISTIHSYCNFLLRTVGIDTTDLLAQGDFDKLFNLIKKHPDCIKPVKHLMLDEGHDTSKDQFEFIFKMIRPQNWCICLDIKQTIYEWRDACPQYVLELMEEEDVKVYDLLYNYRCSYGILNFAKRIIDKLGYDYQDKSIPIKKTVGKIIEDVFSPQKVVEYIEEHPIYNQWFVLTRTNNQIVEIGNYFDKKNIPYFTFKQGETTLEELKIKMAENKVALITIHSAKGLERENVVVVDAKFWNAEETRLSYVAATRAKNLLIWLPIKKTTKKNSKQTSNWA